MEASNIIGRKRFLTVDTLGLVLRAKPPRSGCCATAAGSAVLVTAASVTEREGGKQVLKQVQQMGKRVSRLHTIWADGGFDGEPFMQWVMDVCRWIVQVVVRPQQTLMVRGAQKKVGRGADLRLGSWAAAD
jgi:putative transposase